MAVADLVVNEWPGGIVLEPSWINIKNKAFKS